MIEALIAGTDLGVSRVGLGCNNFGFEALANLSASEAREVVDAALSAGINFFDTADSYGMGASERMLGQALVGRRSEAVIATKFGNQVKELVEEDAGRRATRTYIRRAIEGQLRRLQTDYIDLYYYHRPDPWSPLDETIEALSELTHEGAVRYVACSNFSTDQLIEAKAISDSMGHQGFVCVQNRFNLLEPDAANEMIPLCLKLGMSFIPYHPLARGLLSGKYRLNQPPPIGSRLEAEHSEVSPDPHVFDRIEAFANFAAERGHSLVELAISSLASRQGIPSVIVGATSASQVVANAAAGDWVLTEAELDELGKL